MVRKKFIDKKNATKFYLGHRSQKDPLVTDPDAPQRVLIPIDDPQPGPSGTCKNNKEDVLKKKEELVKWGIYFDDDYDYLKHLKDSKEVSNIEWDICERIPAPVLPPPKAEASKEFQLKLPSSVFGSEYVEEIGLLNKAAPSFGPRPDLDPDIIAALDDDFDYDDENNELEDNFMELANEVKEDGSGSGEENSDDYEDMSDEDEVGSLNGRRFSDDEDEKQTRFTNYSMSSSVVKRNDQLTLIDDRFEKMFEGYEDNEIGALDCDEIEGDLDPSSQFLLNLADKYEEDRKRDLTLPEKISNLAIQNIEEESTDLSSEESEEETTKKLNCETIFTTIKPSIYKPRVITEPPKNKIRIKGKFGMPEGVFGKGLTAANLKELDRAEGIATSGTKGKSIVSTFSFRSKTETPAERLERKRIVREYRKERREEKKANALAFKDEKKRQEKVRLNNRANLHGLIS